MNTPEKTDTGFWHGPFEEGFPFPAGRTFGEIFRDVLRAGADLERHQDGRLIVKNGKSLPPALLGEIKDRKEDLQEEIQPGENLHVMAERCWRSQNECHAPPGALCLCTVCPRWTDHQGIPRRP